VEQREDEWNRGKTSGTEGRRVEQREDEWNRGRTSGTEGRRVEQREDEWNRGKTSGTEGGRVEQREDWTWCSWSRRHNVDHFATIKTEGRTEEKEL
jgi:hypothetical protein